MMKNICLLFLFLTLNVKVFAQDLGQTLQIHVDLHSLYGDPQWLLMVRDLDSGLISPYLFSMRKKTDYFLAFTWAHTYQIIASELRFGRWSVIENFCGLQDGAVKEKSFYIVLKGDLSPVKETSQCYVMKSLPISIS